MRRWFLTDYLDNANNVYDVITDLAKSETTGDSDLGWWFDETRDH